MSGHENRRDAFRAWMAANDLSAADVARRATIPPTTIYSYLDGKSRSLRGDTEQRIAQAFNVTVELLFTARSGMGRDVGVWGKIGARADIFPLSDYADNPMYEVSLPPGLNPDEEYVAFEIEGFSMPPAEPGWLVVFRKVESMPEDLINSACLVDTADGRRLFKRLRKGYAPGLYNLESWDGSPLIENVEVVGALPFAALTPGRKGR
jgi:transcriptional regulator with XRE-family HTH domain